MRAINMKKHRLLFLSFLSIFCLALPACDMLLPKGNKNRSSKEEVSSQISEQDYSSAHKHSYGEWVVEIEPTCTDSGIRFRECYICGQRQYSNLAPLGHDFVFDYQASDYISVYHCSRCGLIEERYENNSEWAEPIYREPDYEGLVGYSLFDNLYNPEVKKIEIRALDGTLEAGSDFKSGTAEGFMKLRANLNSVSWRFLLDLGKGSYYATIYQRGFMDSFSNNMSKTYRSVSSTSQETEEGNFRVTVNEQIVDKSAYMDVPYGDMLATGQDSSYLGDNYSPIALCPIGEAFLYDGENVITYTRLNSYNLTISDIVVVLQRMEHEHVIASEWSYNEDSHWHACVALGCPVQGGARFDNAMHVFGEAYDIIDPASCYVSGSYKKQCAVCGYVKTYETTKDHAWSEWYQVQATTCQDNGVEERKCLDCGLAEQRLVAKISHDYGEAIATELADDDHIATTTYQCLYCGQSFMRWSALDYDPTLSDTTIDRQADYIRFGSGKTENKGGAYSLGSHIFYKIKVDQDIPNAGLSFYIRNSSGLSGNAPVFATISNDSSIGYIDNGDGTLSQSPSRYGLRVNGVEYFLGEDTYGNQSNATGWFDWPVSFSLSKGINIIDVFAYGGYRARMMEFQISGIPNGASEHTHTSDGTWYSNEFYHWHVCNDVNCPMANGVYNRAAHTYGEPFDIVESTCSSHGSYKQQCAICGYVQTVALETSEHIWDDVALNEGSDVTMRECSMCHTVAYDLSIASPAKLKTDISWDISSLPAGPYNVELYACAASTTLQQQFMPSGTSRYQFKIDDGGYINCNSEAMTYGDYGFGTGEKIETCQWSLPICEIEIFEGASTFTIHWTNLGYSAFIAAVRLIPVI